MGKKTLILSEKQIEKVRQGLIAYENSEPDYEIGFEEPVDMSSYAHVVNENIIHRSILNEENRTQKKKCIENITNNVPYIVRNFLDTPLLELPSYLQDYLMQLPTLFNSVANNQNGCNKFIDYLRLNLYSQFGIGRNDKLQFYIPGISRIACHDLNFYAFDYSIRGGEILVFGKFLKLLKFKTDFMLDGTTLDPDLNGMSYEDIIETYSDKMKLHNKDVHAELDNSGFNEDNTSEYEIISIPDTVNGNMLVPTREGLSMLRELGNYCDWCVCGSAAQAEYAQYLSNGGKMYVCMKKGFQNIQKPETPDENCPMDEYGLSLINVIVGSDGMPDNITTRWNHEFGGENHKDLWYATQLQKILDVDYRSVFKPRSYEELRQLRLTSENTEKQNLIVENVSPEDVDLSSFEIQTELNPKFWKDEKLDSRIRLKLLDIADDFVDFLEVSWAEPEDITMTGSLANYTWNEKYSDIDLHIIYDFNDIDERTDFVEGYFDGKKISEGEGFFLSKNTMHEYHSSKNNPWSYFWVILNGENADNFINKLIIIDKNGIFKYNFISELRNFTKTFFDTDKTISQLKAMGIFLLLMSCNEEERIIGGNKYVKEAKKYMECNLYRNLSIVEIANFLHISDRYLYNLFIEYEGISPKEYLMRLKTNYALKYLNEGKMNITEIATSLGFSDVFAFSRFFKKRNDVSPKEYKEINK